MYIHRLSLRNIRGFENIDFTLARPGGTHAGWTVFTGNNGSGKSTLLKAIAVCLTGKDTARALQPSFHRWIRDSSEGEASIGLEIQSTPGDDSMSGPGTYNLKRPFPVKMMLKNGGKDTTLAPSTPSGKAKKAPERSVWSQEAAGWFSCGYGPFRRMFGASPEATRQMVAPSTERFVTMFQEAASLAEVDQWLRNLKHKELEGKSAEKKQLALTLEVLRNDLMPDGVQVDRVDSDGLWLRDPRGVALAWTEMSDGYRSAAALLVDIVRQLIGKYGMNGLIGRADNGTVVIKRSGVVLIDEIDAHLHPEWQQKIGFWLKKHFPAIQFLVTTHSPIICQAADPRGLFVLGNEPRQLTDEEHRKIVSSRPDTILLTPAFGLQNTRSCRTVESRSQLARLRSKKRAGVALSQREMKEQEQLKLFVNEAEEP